MIVATTIFFVLFGNFLGAVVSINWMLTTCLIKYPIYDGEKSSVGRVQLLTDSWKRVSAMKIKLFNIQQHIHKAAFVWIMKCERWRVSMVSSDQLRMTNDAAEVCWVQTGGGWAKVTIAQIAHISYNIYTIYTASRWFECRAESRTCSFILLIDLNECKNTIFFFVYRMKFDANTWG